MRVTKHPALNRDAFLSLPFYVMSEKHACNLCILLKEPKQRDHTRAQTQMHPGVESAALWGVTAIQPSAVAIRH